MMKSKNFRFDYINNGTSTIQSKCISFFCPICSGIHLAIGLESYTPYHDFFCNISFFCGNCFSQYHTLFNDKIKLISRSFYYEVN